MIVNNKTDSAKDFEAQGNRLPGFADGIIDTSPKKKRSRRLPGRSKSLVEETGSDSKPSDVNRNMGRQTQSYLRRAPTQDDIYKILTETSDSLRPSTGELKRLSPYVPLPAIGIKFRPLKDSDSEVKETVDSSSVTSNEEGNQKLVREGTYNVLEPKFVRGPIVSDDFRNLVGNLEENDNKERLQEAVDQFQLLSRSTVFGSRLSKQKEDVIEEDLTANDCSGLQRDGEFASNHLNVQSNKSVSGNQTNNTPMQKLYYRDVRKTDCIRPENTDLSVHKGASVRQALWFD